MKKTIYGLILAVFFGFYIFFGNELGGVNAKALTVDDIQTVDDLKGTSWLFNDTLINDYTNTIKITSTSSITNNYAQFSTSTVNYTIGGNSSNSYIMQLFYYSFGPTRMFQASYTSESDEIIRNLDLSVNDSWRIGEAPRYLNFYTWPNGELVVNGDFIGWLKSNATLQQDYNVTINWPILDESMILTSGQTVTINFDELMQTYKNYEYVEKTWSVYSFDDITLPLYYKLTGFYLTNTPEYSEDLFFSSGTHTFTENIYLWAVSEPPDDYVFSSYVYYNYKTRALEAYDLLIPFSDNEVNINWTYDEEMIIEITGAQDFKIALKRFDQTSTVNIIEYSYTNTNTLQFYIDLPGYYFNKVDVISFNDILAINGRIDEYEFNPQEDIEYYDLTNRNINIQVDNTNTSKLNITNDISYNYEAGENDGDQLNGAMITFFSLITGLINIKFGFISIGGILAILFGVALLTFIFKIWNGNNNG